MKDMVPHLTPHMQVGQCPSCSNALFEVCFVPSYCNAWRATSAHCKLELSSQDCCQEPLLCC